MLAEFILRKRGLRNDRFWVNKLLYRDPVRRVPLALDTAILMKSQYWPRERIDALARARLGDILRRASRVPLWKERLAAAGIDPRHATHQDFWKLPLLTKHDFRSNPVEVYTDARMLSLTHTDHTSGSTGMPFEFRLDWRAELRYFAVRERMFRSVVGGKKLPVLYFRGRVNKGFFFGRHVLFFLQGYNSIRHRLAEFIDAARAFPHGFVLYGYTSSFVELARRLNEAGVELPIRAIVATGESAQESNRAYIESTLRTNFFLTYATWEVKWIGHECEQHRCHINEEYVFVETVDDNGVSLPHGQEGRVVVTSFDSETMPFIRYALGDRGVISDEPCPCGRTLRTIQIFGRQNDIISLPDNRSVPLFDVSTAFDTFARAVRQYQIIQLGACDFLIRVVAGPLFVSQRERLHLKLVGILHPSAAIRWEVVDDIPQAKSGKAAYFLKQF